MRGIVAWFNTVKSYGFIRQESGGPDIFCHYSDINMEGFKTLEKGQRVIFEIGKASDSDRTVAKNVVPLPMRPEDKEK